MSIQWIKTVGQNRIKENFDRSIECDQLGHAYLFAGKAGVGKFSLALEIALTLLCRSEQKPCYQCDSCRKVLSHSHPDFRYLFPLSFSAEHRVKGNPQKLNDAGWDYIAEELKRKLSNPYLAHKEGGSIPVDWIREMNQSIQRGATENGYTVVIVEGIDTFRAEAANAMLKTLEEPPAQTIMILLTNSIHAVLPTIKSRCQIHRFGAIEPQPLRDYLANLFPERANDVERVSSLCYGSLGKALELMDHENDNLVLTKGYFDIIFGDDSPLKKALALELFIEQDIEKDFPRAMAIVNALIEECRFAYLHQFTNSAEYIFSALAAQKLQRLSRERVEKLIKAAEEALLSLKKHTPILMVFVNLTLHLSEIIDE